MKKARVVTDPEELGMMAHQCSLSEQWSLPERELAPSLINGSWMKTKAAGRERTLQNLVLIPFSHQGLNQEHEPQTGGTLRDRFLRIATTPVNPQENNEETG